MVSKVALGIVVVLVIAGVAAAVVLSSSPSSGTTTLEASTTGSGASSGKLAVMATDPPYSSGSNTKEYEHYNNVGAHRSPATGQSSTTQSSSNSGWVLLNASGTVQLNALVNSSQTLAVANIGATAYDAITLYVDSATVTYNGQNYSARMNTNQVTATLTTDAQVTGSSAAVVVFDLRTVAINAGSSSNPQFVMSSSARAEAAPSGTFDSTSLQAGVRTDLAASAWFQTFARSNARLQVTAASISSSSLSISVKDTGSESANATYVVVTPASTLVAANVVIPDSIQGSAIFTVSSTGTLQSTSSILSLGSASGSHLTVTSSNSATLTYGGNIQFGAGAILGVQTGQTYLITVVGDNSVATFIATAS